jgi:peptide/nickel transport system substrate-binding protein
MAIRRSKLFKMGFSKPIHLTKARCLHILMCWMVLVCIFRITPVFAQSSPQHGLSMYGTPNLPANFEHLPYANPSAPKGGRFTQAQEGSFDSLNPFIIKGNAPASLVPYIVQPLMLRSADEAFTVYGLIAQTIETPQNRSWVEFKLNPKATFSDGKPVTSKDVAFSWGLLKDHGRPAQRGTYSQVTEAQTPDLHTIRFVFVAPNYELPMLLALMPVFASHATDETKFEDATLKMPLGSGPYLLSNMEAGNSFTLKRNPNFWGKDLPILRGVYNFDELKFDFYRDPNAMFEAFKSQLYDVRVETSTMRWLTGYDIGAVRDGRIVKDIIKFEAPKALTALIFNTRKPLFSSIKTREAFTQVFDFEWLNRNLFSSIYTRTNSYFEGSNLSSHKQPASEQERKLLAPFSDTILPEIMNGTFQLPVSDGSGRDRALFQRAIQLLKTEGYEQRNGIMVSIATGKPLTFEILVTTRDKLQVASVYGDTLKLLGITPSIRLADSSQYWSRLRKFDYDMILETYINSASPGNEQVNRWSSAAASREASLNYAGVKSQAVDAMLASLLAARGKEDFVAAVRALDRALLSGFYLIPLYNAPERWIARASRVSHSPIAPKFELAIDTWWTTTP